MNKITVIAEIGINHNGNMETARELIKRAKSCGADIAKFQLYDVDKVFPDKKIMAQGKNWYQEVKKTQLTYERMVMLAAYCNTVNIEFMASAFDLERLSWLEGIGVKRHKIATSVNQDKELIRAMLNTKKEVLFSCRERSSTYSLFDYIIPNYDNIKWLYCVPLYPTPLSKLNLKTTNFPGWFQGISDHTEGIEASMMAMSRGAKIIEKHFCLKRDNSNPDMICSIEPGELKQLVQFARKVEEVL